MAVGNELELALRIRALVEGQQGIIDLGESFVDINKRIETLTRGLVAVTGSTEGAQREFDYLKGVADSSGLAILDLADNYIKLTASAKGTNLEGEATKTIFESVSNAMAVLGGDTVTTYRAFTALAQMMSKGQIYSEELKGQLAEAIPGALQIMSRALGISTKDMLDLMSAGKLSSDVLLPFAEQLNKEFGQFATTSTTFVQAINHIKNSWVELMSRIGDTGIWHGITSAINGLGESANIVAGILGAGLGVAIQKVIVSVADGTRAIHESIKTTLLYGSASEQAAKAELDRAAAAKRTAQEQVISATIAEKSAQTTLLAANAQVSANERSIKSLLAKNAVLSDVAAANNKLSAAEERVVIAQEKVTSTSNKLAQAKLVEVGAINAGNEAAATEFKAAIAREASASATLRINNLVVAGYERKLLAIQQLVAAEEKASATGTASAATLLKETEANDRLTAAKDRLLAAQERDSLAKKELVAAGLALTGAGQRELAASIELTAQRERESLVAQKQLSDAQRAVLASEARVKSLIAEGGTAQQVDLAYAALALSQSRAGTASDRATEATKKLKVARLEEAEAMMTADIAANNLAKSQGLLSKAWSFLIGPGGMFALVVLGIISMIKSFGDQDQATQDLTKSTEEYKSSLDKLSSIQLSSSVAASDRAIASKKSEIAVTEALIDAQETEGESIFKLGTFTERLGAVYDYIIDKLRFWVSDDKKRQELNDSLATQNENLIKLELNRALAMDAVRSRYPELLQKQEEEIQKVNKLTAERDSALNTYNSLLDAYYLGKVSIDELSIAGDRYIAKNRELSSELNKQQNVTNEVSNAQKAYAEITGLTEEQVNGIITIGEDYIKTMDSEGQATARKIQAMVALSKEQKAHEAELKALKTENEALEKSEKARIDTLIRQANALGTLAQQRQANIDKANAEVSLSAQQEIVLKKELAALEENLRIQKESLSFKGVNEQKIAKEISDTEALIIKKKGEIEARESTTAALKAEALAAELSNALISESLDRQQTKLAETRSELEELLLKYQRFKDWGVDQTAIEAVLQRINAKIQEIGKLTDELPTIFTVAARKIGLDWDELTSDIDFKTKQTIDSIKTLASAGILSGDQLRKALTNLINSADTETEIEAVISALSDLQRAGKLTGADFSEFTGLIRSRISAVAQDASFGEIRKKLELIGSESLNNISIQERVLIAQKNEAQASADLATQKGYEYTARQNIIKVAEIEAQLASLNADRKAIEANAAIQVARSIQDEIQSRTKLGEIISDIDREKMKSAQNAVDVAVIESKAANDSAELARRKMEAIKNSSVETKQATDSVTHGFVEQTRAAEENKKAMEEGAKQTAAFALLQKQLTEYLNGARARMDEMSHSARLYFEAMLEGTLAANAIQGAAQGSLRATQAWTNATREGSDAIAEFEGKIATASAQIGAARQDLLFAADDMRVWISAISLSEAATTKAFYEQASSAESLRLRIHEMVESGRLDMAALNSAELEAKNGFKLLDDQDLANLRSEIEAAKQKLEEMGQATEDARQKLAGMNAELLEAKGEDQKAQLLRQQIDYQERLAEIEKQRREAELLGNHELVAILDKQAAVLRQINDAKTASIQADQGAQQSGDRVANSWNRAETAIRSTGAALGEVHNLGQRVAEIDLSRLSSGFENAARSAATLREML